MIQTQLLFFSPKLHVFLKAANYKKCRFLNYCHSKSSFLLLLLRSCRLSSTASCQPRRLRHFPASSGSNGGFLLFPVPALLGKHAASPSYKGPILLHHAGIRIQRETCMIIFGIWRWGSAGGVCILEVGVRARHTSPCSDSFWRFPGFCFGQARAGAACDGAAVLSRLCRRVRPPVC